MADASLAGVPAMLALLQLMDSSFPVGTFAHSYGLEQAVRDGHVRDARGVEAFVNSTLALQVATTDARALARAYGAATWSLDDVRRIDDALYVTKASREMRDASTATGRRLLQEVTAHPEGRSGLASAYLEAAEHGLVTCTHPIALALVGVALEVRAVDLVAGLLFSTANTLHQAAMRLLPVSHRDAQAALHRTRAEVAHLASEVAETADEPLTSFHPVQEIASMRHERAAVRFFAS